MPRDAYSASGNKKLLPLKKFLRRVGSFVAPTVSTPSDQRRLSFRMGS
jgi:hypothetical protein